MRAGFFFFLFFSMVAAACGDDDGMPMPMADAGPGDAAPADSGTPDATVDRDPPTVVATMPADGEADVGVDAALVIRFSEPIDPASGAVTVTSDGLPIAVTATWDGGGAELTLEPEAALPSGAEIHVAIPTDFRDLAGNPLAAPYAFDFVTRDVIAP